MANVFDYIKWRGDLSFEASPISEIDILIFAELSYLSFDDIPNCQNNKSYFLYLLSKAFFKKHKLGETSLGAIVPEQILNLFYELSDTVRYKNVKVSNYVNITDISKEEQFAAVTFETKDTTIIAFRGTDDTIVGWQENFNMAFKTPVPAQEDAVKYLNTVGKFKKNIVICGHSKGGNLAVYAASKCNKSIKKKIRAIYNFDGPGFKDNFFVTEDFISIKDRLTTIVPKESIIGMLLDHGSNYTIVDSINKGLWQHDALSWQLMGNQFVRCKDRTDTSKFFDKSFSKWIATMNDDERTDLVDIIFEILYSTNDETLTDISGKRAKLLAYMNTLPSAKRKFLLQKFAEFITENAGSVIVDDFVKPKIDSVKKDIKDFADSIFNKNKTKKN